MGFSINNAGLDKKVFPPLPIRKFNKKYSAAERKPGLRELLLIGRWLHKNHGKRKVIGLAFHPWHNQTTLWWFEQGLLNLMAAAGWDMTLYTDAHYKFDEDLLHSLPGKIHVQRVPDRNEFILPKDDADIVISLFPCDEAINLARSTQSKLVTFAIKNLRTDLVPLQQSPPPNSILWHAFAGSKNFKGASSRVLGVDNNWQSIGAPFPVNRYYFPVRKHAKPAYPVLLLGSKGRDYQLLFEALHQAKINKISALIETEHINEIHNESQKWGIDCAITPPSNHLKVLELIENTQIVVNPITPPWESHYSVSTPLALGRPIVASKLPSVAPFVGDGLLTAELGNVDDWREKIQCLLQDSVRPCVKTLRQAKEKHDMSRFFASAITHTCT